MVNLVVEKKSYNKTYQHVRLEFKENLPRHESYDYQVISKCSPSRKIHVLRFSYL